MIQYYGLKRSTVYKNIKRGQFGQATINVERLDRKEIPDKRGLRALRNGADENWFSYVYVTTAEHDAALAILMTVFIVRRYIHEKVY